MRNTEVAGLQDRLANLNRGAGGNGWIDSDFEPAVLSGISAHCASSCMSIQGPPASCYCICLGSVPLTDLCAEGCAATDNLGR